MKTKEEIRAKLEEIEKVIIDNTTILHEAQFDEDKENNYDKDDIDNLYDNSHILYAKKDILE